MLKLKRCCFVCKSPLSVGYPSINGLHESLCMRCEGAMIEVYKVEYGKAFYVDMDIEGVYAAIGDLEVGDSYTISKIQMRATEYINLPEFDGF